MAPTLKSALAAEPASELAEPVEPLAAGVLFPPQAARDRDMATAMTIASSFFMGE